MALRSRYRERIPAVENSTPDIPERVSPSERVEINFDTTDKAEPAVAIVGEAGEPGDAVTEALQKAVEADEAALSLRRQLEHLRTSEALQRQHAQQMAEQAQRPLSREQKLATWRANGGDEGDISFLESHPEMIDRHDVTVVAAEEAAQQGFQRGTPQHRERTREIFEASLQPQPAASARPAVADPAGFFQPPPLPSPSPASVHDHRASIVSAPVSRGTPSGETGLRPTRQVRLTAEEQEYARVAGVSDVEYARQKQKLAQAKANGDYGERR